MELRAGERYYILNRAGSVLYLLKVEAVKNYSGRSGFTAEFDILWEFNNIGVNRYEGRRVSGNQLPDALSVGIEGMVYDDHDRKLIKELL